MTRMNWDKVRRQEMVRRHGSEHKSYEFKKEKRATDKQIVLIFKHKMMVDIPTELTLSEATAIISRFAQENGWNNAR